MSSQFLAYVGGDVLTAALFVPNNALAGCPNGAAHNAAVCTLNGAATVLTCDVNFRTDNGVAATAFAVTDTTHTVCLQDYCIWGTDSYSGANFCYEYNPAGTFERLVLLGSAQGDDLEFTNGGYNLGENTVLFHGDMLGNAGADVLVGSDRVSASYKDTIWGGAGIDTISGGLGDDHLQGEGDGDWVDGGSGVDNIEGGDAADTIFGGANADVISGGPGADVIDGDGDNDVIYGGDDADDIAGGTGHDTIYGQSGSDILAGDADNDTIYGDIGDDILCGDTGTDVLYGNDGNNDILYGPDAVDTLSGGNGNNDACDNRTAFDGTCEVLVAAMVKPGVCR